MRLVNEKLKGSVVSIRNVYIHEDGMLRDTFHTAFLYVAHLTCTSIPKADGATTF